MFAIGHIGGALLFYAPIVLLFHRYVEKKLLLGGLCVAVLFARLPDIDIVIPQITHRGVTHTVWFVALVVLIVAGLAALVATKKNRNATKVGGFVGGVVGVSLLSHLALDVITPAGLTPLLPAGFHVTLSVTPASNTVANMLFLCLGMVVLGVTSLIVRRR